MIVNWISLVFEMFGLTQQGFKIKQTAAPYAEGIWRVIGKCDNL